MKKSLFNKIKTITSIIILISVSFTGGFVLTIDVPDNIEIKVSKNNLTVANEESSQLELNGETINILPFDEVDGGEIKEGGRGYAIDISTPDAVINSTYGKCVDLDGQWGSQCWDLSALISENQVGRWLSTCGTGKASGMMDCYIENAGEDYDVIWNSNELAKGDIAVFDGGEFGHVGMIVENLGNGWAYLLGANQGGEPCEGGGSAVNIIKINLNKFKGAYRWKGWEVPEPEPTPIPITGCYTWDVQQGDTMSGIMLNCEGTIVYGEAMNNYAKTWYSTIVKPNQSVYDGWNSKEGVGLYDGDTIKHEVGQ